MKYGLASGQLKYSKCPLRGNVDLFYIRVKGKGTNLNNMKNTTTQKTYQCESTICGDYYYYYLFFYGEAIKRQPAVYLGCVKM